MRGCIDWIVLYLYDSSIGISRSRGKEEINLVAVARSIARHPQGRARGHLAQAEKVRRHPDPDLDLYFARRTCALRNISMADPTHSPRRRRRDAGSRARDRRAFQ